MAYQKTNWQDTIRDSKGNIIQRGTPLNAQALSKMEEGIVQAEQKIDDEIGKVTTQLAQKTQEIENLKSQLVPKRNVFGEQLLKLKNALSNPLHQRVNLVFVGDSITWGMAASGNPPVTPRNGQLSDVRDLFSSNSWVNNIKRYIQKKYAFNATPVLTNHSTSPSGESIAEFTIQQKIFPLSDDVFNYTFEGTTSAEQGFNYRVSAQSLFGHQINHVCRSSENYILNLEFDFTGNSFIFVYDATTSTMDYELFVDGTSQGIFETRTSVSAGEYGKQRTHTFNFVDNKKIKIVSVKRTDINVNQNLYITGILVDKKIRVKNQGIIGITAKQMKERTIDVLSYGSLLDETDKFVFVQLGTNDRLIASGVIKGQSGFKKYLTDLVDAIKTNREVVLMCANPVANENTTTHSFTMQDARNIIYQIAKTKNLDFVDNYSVFGDATVSSFTTDGIHPNDSGHEVISRNIINAIEFN